jgi:hypothetical protein
MFYTNDIAAQTGSKQVSRTYRFPAPVRGLIRNENIALTKPAGAYVLENWFPTSTGIRTRRGLRKHATLAGGSAATVVMPYNIAGFSKLFAGNDVGIYDISAPSTPTSAIAKASGVGTISGDDFSYVTLTNSGGTYLFVVNGVNTHNLYNGSTWANNSPAVTTVTTDKWTHVWVSKNRIWGVEKDTQNAVYLSVDSIGGAATRFPLGGIFKKGGKLLSGSTWALDAGNGLNSYTIFLSTEGEVAAYTGIDPATDFVLTGTYKIGRPMGKNAMFHAGGDLVVATEDGLVPISAAINRDQAALQQISVSHPIEELWLHETAARSAYSWNLAIWPTKEMLIVATPTYGGAKNQVLVANTRTGAWTVFTGGWDARGIAVFGSALYFGNSTSEIFEAEVTAADNGASYTCTVAGLFDDIKSPALQKIAKLIRGVFQSSFQTFLAQFSISTDYQSALPASPAASPEPAAQAIWGSATWGAFLWGGSTSRYRKTDWYGVDGVGFSLSWQCQVTLGNTQTPDIELAAVDLVYEVGEAVA